MASTLALLALASGAAHIYCEFKPPLRGRYLFKPLTLGLLMLLVWQAQGLGLLFYGLLFCWLGDVALMMPSRSDRWFLAGLVAFLIGHLMYLALMWGGIGFAPLFAWSLLVGVAAVACWQIVLPAKKLAPAVVAYITAILLMVAAAWGEVVSGALPVIVLYGAALFALSDFLLGYNRFNRPLPLSQIWVLGTYYIAQVLIVSGHLSTGVINAAS